MDTDQLLRALESDRPSVDALHEAQRRPEAVQAAVVAMVEETARGILPVPRQENLLCNGIAVLAAARRTELYRPLLRLCRLPAHVIHFIFGDRATEFLGRAVVSTFDGDPDPLIDVVMDFTSDAFVRWSLMSALARFAFDGRIPRAQAVAVVDRFEAERAGGEQSAAWLGWASMILLLGLRDHADRIRAAWGDGRIAEPTEELDEWLADLEAAAADPSNPARFEHEHATPIDDPMDVLRFPPAEADLDEDDGADKTSLDASALAEDIEPNPAEEGWLSIFLDDRPSMRGDVGLELVDGFLSGIANGPASIDTAECLSMLRRFIALDDGDFASAEQQQYCMGLIERLWQAIALRAQHGIPHPPPFEPSEDEDAGRSWVAGFLGAVATDSQAWRPLVERRSHLPYLQLMVALADGSLEELGRKEPMPTREDFLIRLPTITMEIAAFWRRRREQETMPARVAKVGRNDPCPCGSGRKFKRCCGA